MIFKAPVTAKRLAQAHGLETTRNGSLLYFLYACHACHVSHGYRAHAFRIPRDYQHTEAHGMYCEMTISVTYLPDWAKVYHAMAHDRDCMMQRTSAFWNVMVSTAREGPGHPELCTLCRYVKRPLCLRDMQDSRCSTSW